MKEKFVFEPVGDRKAEDYIEEIIQRANICKNNLDVDISIDIDKVYDAYCNTKQQIVKKYEKIFNFISEHWGKYLHMTFLYKVGRDDNSKWKSELDINIMPYRYIGVNGMLFGLICQLDSEYKGGIEDTSIDLFHLSETHRIEIEEISFEEFHEKAIETIQNCIDYRRNKMNSDKYECGKNGYEHK